MPTLDRQVIDRPGLDTPVIGRSTLQRLIDGVATRIIAESVMLTELDRAIGDGDHGINMRRGMEAVLADIGSTLDQPFGLAMQMIGRQIVASVGGASGPLFATWFLTLGRAWPPESDGLPIEPFEAALQAVKARGRSDVGQKTLIDVLAPLTDAIRAGVGVRELDAVARRAAEATRPMRAERGRAAFLGDRSIGHVDPGAQTVALMIETVAGILGVAEESVA
ncbi:MAG: dihydroxyacetone kinase subunit DhaL [Ancalomicrobiaceae bacterium]|nr:dihydroxyacetone kinase subunit DhaL [Ancalomicrobiaceae bacterium]